MAKIAIGKSAPHLQLADMSIKIGRSSKDLSRQEARPTTGDTAMGAVEVEQALFDALQIRSEVGLGRSEMPGPDTGRFRLDAMVIRASAGAEATRRGIKTDVFNN